MIHSDVMAGTEVVVNGKHGFISGGHVSATSLVDAKILGSEMGTDTVIEVGVSPMVKRRYKELGENMAATIKIMERAVPIFIVCYFTTEIANVKTQTKITVTHRQ